MSEERMLDLNDNRIDRMSFFDICTSAGLGVFALALIWFASSLLVYLVR